MARPAEIPSIVVHNGAASAPGSPSVESHAEPILTQTCRFLTKQASLAEEDEGVDELSMKEENDFAVSASQPSLPIASLPPSPAVSPPTSGVGSRSPNNQTSRSPTLTGCGSWTRSTHCNKYPQSTSPCRNTLPPGPGPGFFPGHRSFEGCGVATGHELQMSENSIRSKSMELQHQRSSESEEMPYNNIPGRHRYFHASRLKLLQRSRALQEDSSPPPDMSDHLGPHPVGLYPHMPNSLTVCQPPPPGCQIGMQRRRLRQQGSSSGIGSSYEGSPPCLSTDSSMEYTDSTGVDLLPFIIQTLHKNQKDRMLLLKIERELVTLVRDPKRTFHKFPHMSSYQRMLVHRVAAFFGMEHNVDQVGTSVIVNKTRNTRLPDTRFKDHIRDELLPPEEPKRAILRRGYASFEDPANYKPNDRLMSFDVRRSKSYEEREEEYEKVRSRIFCEEHYPMDPMMGDRPFYGSFPGEYMRTDSDEPPWIDSRHVAPMAEFVQHRKHYDNQCLRPLRIHKVESFEHDRITQGRVLRPPVFKSHSFGGYGHNITVLSRDDSVASNPSSTALSKQDSTGSSSSGYKTQRQDTSSTNMSTNLSTTPSPTAAATVQYPPSAHAQFPTQGGMVCSSGGDGAEGHPVIWAVTSMEAVPSGALLIDPQTGHPYTNVDGTLYRFDPSNPPPTYKDQSGPQTNVSEVTRNENFQSQDNDQEDDAKVVPGACPGEAGSDVDEGIDRSSCNSSRGNEFEVRDEPARNQHSQIFNQHKNYCQESHLSESFRQMSLSQCVQNTPDSHLSYNQHRPYQQTFYYIPADTVQSLPGGGIKYIYPQYSSGQGALPAQQHMPGVAPIAHNIPLGSASHGAALTEPTQHHLTPGYVPSNYTMMTYPHGGMMPVQPAAAPAPNTHEAGGTTYYCQISSGLPVQPAASNVPNVTLAQPVGYYTGNNQMYHTATAGMQSYSAFSATQLPHQVVGAQPAQSVIPYGRPASPPTTPNTQTMPYGFNSAAVHPQSGIPGAPPYIAVIPTQPVTPTSQPSQMFPTFFRPGVPMQNNTGYGTPNLPPLNYCYGPPRPYFNSQTHIFDAKSAHNREEHFRKLGGSNYTVHAPNEYEMGVRKGGGSGGEFGVDNSTVMPYHFAPPEQPYVQKAFVQNNIPEQVDGGNIRNSTPFIISESAAQPPPFIPYNGQPQMPFNTMNFPKYYNQLTSVKFNQPEIMRFSLHSGGFVNSVIPKNEYKHRTKNRRKEKQASPCQPF